MLKLDFSKLVSKKGGRLKHDNKVMGRRKGGVSGSVARSEQLTVETTSRSLVEMEYSVKSRVFLRYSELKSEMERGVKKPFDSLLPANIGDPQGFGQPPLTFLRQVLALCLWPALGRDRGFACPEDARARAAQILAQMPHGSVGASPNKRGLPIVRQHVCEFIRERDGGGSASADRVVLQPSYKSIDNLFKAVNASVEAEDEAEDKPAGVLVPIPMYPVYSAALSKNDMPAIGYYLDEDKDWELDVKKIEGTVDEARRYCRPSGMVVINPGNPTGQVLPSRNVEDIVRFCHRQNMFILADEVYQQTVHDPDVEFCSFKKVKRGLGEPYAGVQLASIHSASKGFAGECGLRGGYIEFDAFRDDVLALFFELCEVEGAGNVAGQIAVDVLARPPCQRGPSWDRYHREKTNIQGRLRQKSRLLVDRLNAIDGIRVNTLHGGLFAYAAITDMPAGAIEKAAKLKQDPSLLWALELLDETGIAIVPGASFKQKPGTYHFRVTIVPTIEIIEKVVKGIKYFHKKFVKTYK